jgi:hypothetical protein
MSKSKNNVASKDINDKPTKNKGESEQSHQKGAKSVSSKGSGKHKADESDGAAKNTTKKQQNSI